MTRETTRSSRRFPPRRAIVGGALIAVSALGVFTAHRSAGTQPHDRYVVAVREVPAGTVLTTADLGAMALDLPEGVEAIPADRAQELVGLVTDGALAEFELLSRRDVYPRSHFVRPHSAELALDLPAARALQGLVSTGDVVSVLSTDPQGTGTTVLTDDALITSMSSPSKDSIGSVGLVRVVLSLTSQDTATAVADASVRSEVTLMRSPDRDRTDAAHTADDGGEP